MTPEQQVLVQTSFAKVAPVADSVATLFYDDLFQRNRRLRSLFKDDMTEQRKMLMSMLGTAVANLHDWNRVAGALRALGARHVSYGVATADYDTVGAVLIATLEKALGDDFTPETRDAWVTCYTAIVGEMLGATTDGTPA